MGTFFRGLLVIENSKCLTFLNEMAYKNVVVHLGSASKMNFFEKPYAPPYGVCSYKFPHDLCMKILPTI